jgi:WD40 repeat protein
MSAQFCRLACVIGIFLLLTTLPVPAAPPQQDCHGDPLPEGAVARMGTARLRHGDGVSRVVYSPNGELLASLSRDRTLRVWEAASGKLVHVFSEKHVDFYAVAWSPDGLSLAAAGDDPLHGGKAGIRFFDLQSGKEIKRLTGHNQTAYFLAFVAEGKILMSVSPGQVIRWDATSGDRLSEWQLERTAAVDVSPDGQTLAWVASDGEDKTLHICDAATGQERRRLRGHQWAVVSVAFSADGRCLASGNPFEPVQLWDVVTGEPTRRYAHQQGGMRLRFSPDGKSLVCACMDGSVQRWDAETGAELPRLTGYRGWVNEIAFAPGCQSLALAGADSQVIQLWDLNTGQQRSVAAGHQSKVNAIAFSPDGKLLATCGGDWHDQDQTIYLWDAATGKEIRRLTGHAGKIWCLQFSADGKLLASGSEKESVLRVWDVATGQEQAKLKRERQTDREAQECRVSAVAWSADGRLLVSGHDQGLLFLWDYETGAPPRWCGWHEGIIHSVAFSPNGKYLLSGSADRTVRLWDVASGEELRRFGDSTETVRCVAYAPDGRLIAASLGDFEGATVIWEAASGREVARLRSPQGHVNQIAFSPDGKLLAGAGAGNALCIWEVATRTERCRFPSQSNGGPAIAFAPNGQTIASGSQDTTVILWDLQHGSDDARPHTRQDIEKLWNDLRSTDASLAHRAICSLAIEPTLTVTFFREHLKLPEAMNSQRLAKTLSELDDDRYQVRERAMQDLARLGEIVEPLLRHKLEEQPSLEVRQRVQMLLNNLKTSTPAPDHLRVLRAFEVLERIGTDEARELFETHARQSPAGPLTREAQACLYRLGSR